MRLGSSVTVVNDPEHSDSLRIHGRPAAIASGIAYAKIGEAVSDEGQRCPHQSRITDYGPRSSTLSQPYRAALDRRGSPAPTVTRIEICCHQRHMVRRCSEPWALEKQIKEFSVASLVADAIWSAEGQRGSLRCWRKRTAVERIVRQDGCRSEQPTKQTVNKSLPTPKRLDIDNPSEKPLEVAAAVSARKVEQITQAETVTAAVKAEEAAPAATPEQPGRTTCWLLRAAGTGSAILVRNPVAVAGFFGE